MKQIQPKKIELIREAQLRRIIRQEITNVMNESREDIEDINSYIR